MKGCPPMGTNSRSKMGVGCFLQDQGMIIHRPTSEAANAQDITGNNRYRLVWCKWTTG